MEFKLFKNHDDSEKFWTLLLFAENQEDEEIIQELAKSNADIFSAIENGKSFASVSFKRKND